MKRIRIIELFANIKANFVSFFSISMFVALGLGLFCGVQWGATALCDAVQAEIDKGNVHDLEISFPYGLTQANIDEIKKTGGVSQVEVGYSDFAYMIDGSNSHVLKIQSMTDTVNQPTLVRGNMPVENNEIALLRFWAEKKSIKVGDTIKLKHDATDSNDKDGMKSLQSDTFVVTALVDNPVYISNETPTLGVSGLGSGGIDCVGYITKQAFDSKYFNNAYSNAFVSCDSLKGVNTMSTAYRDGVKPVKDALVDLGKKLGKERYDSLHSDAQQKIEDGQRKLSDAEQQLSDGKKKLEDAEQQVADGKQQLTDGQKTLADSKATLSDVQVTLADQLNEAYRQLVDGQAKYDAGLAAYNTAFNLYTEINAKFEAVRPQYDEFVTLYNELRAKVDGLRAQTDTLSALIAAYREAPEDKKEEAWAAVRDHYAAIRAEYGLALEAYSKLSETASAVAEAMGFPIGLDPLPALPEEITPETADAVVEQLRQTVNTLEAPLNSIANMSITVGDYTVWLLDVPTGLEDMHATLASTKETLDAAKAQLDGAWAEYNAGKLAYEQKVGEGKLQIIEGESQLTASEQVLSDSEKQLQDGKTQLEQKTQELNEKKNEFNDAQKKFDAMVEYRWVVTPRNESGGIQLVDTTVTIMDRVRWAMASLFIIVGLFVCYSAISRLVYEQIVQIGTKKALGFRSREITASYLAFTALAVGLGLIICALLGYFMVQGIMNPKASMRFNIPDYGPSFNPIDVVVMGAIELVLMFVSTWIAMHGLLKREALDLLRGESTANAKERWYERLRIWQRMSLYSQTIVNNCVNDKRRVIGTIIGVVGCTALIVSAVTLAANVSASIKRHYEAVYSYNQIVYIDTKEENAIANVSKALYDKGLMSAPVYIRQVTFHTTDGKSSVARLVVPMNEDSFQNLYHVNSLDGSKTNIENGGLWMCAAYGEHSGSKAGDQVALTDFSGKEHTFKIAGFFEYYLIRNEFVLSQREYRQAFGEMPKANALLVNTADYDSTTLSNSLESVKGYQMLFDDRAQMEKQYGSVETMLLTVVQIYLVLSAMMALIVLLNLDIMFVDEKKRELIVLMINGFSARQAQAYIYRDSIVLTIIGILIGIVLGSVAGNITVSALEPAQGYFIKQISSIAVGVGALGAGVFSMAVLLYALRRIPRFKLTDINRY